MTASTHGSLAMIDDFVQSGAGSFPTPFLTKIREWLHVGDFPVAGTGTTDDTTAFQAAVIEAGASKRKLIFPALPQGGSIRLTAPIAMPYAITLEGDGTETDATLGISDSKLAAKSGSWFYLDHLGKGFVHQTGYSGGLIRPQGGRVSYKGIGTIRNQPVDAPGWTPAANEFDFWLDWPDCELDDIMTLNGTNGINVLKNGRATLNNIKGQAFANHIQITSAYDVCRLNNIHSWLFATDGLNIVDWQMKNGRAINSFRNDNPQLSNIFSFGYRFGLFIGVGADDSADPSHFPGGTTQRAQISNFGADATQVAMYVDSTVTGSCFIDMVNFYGLQEDRHASSQASLITILGSNCLIRAANLELTRASGNSVRLAGTNNEMSIHGFRTALWNQSALGFTALEALGSSKIYLDKNVMAGLGNPANLFNTSQSALGLEKKGSFNASTDASAQVTIAHGLYGPPDVVDIIPTGGFFVWTLVSSDSVNFTIRVYNDVAYSSPKPSAAVSFKWCVKS